MSDKLKKRVAEKAIEWLEPQLEHNTVIGIGTGATVDYFVDLLTPLKNRFFRLRFKLKTILKAYCSQLY